MNAISAEYNTGKVIAKVKPLYDKLIVQPAGDYYRVKQGNISFRP